MVTCFELVVLFLFVVDVVVGRVFVYFCYVNYLSNFYGSCRNGRGRELGGVYGDFREIRLTRIIRGSCL